MTENKTQELCPDLEAIATVAKVPKQHIQNLKGVDTRAVYADAGIPSVSLQRGAGGFENVEDLDPRANVYRFADAVWVLVLSTLGKAFDPRAREDAWTLLRRNFESDDPQRYLLIVVATGESEVGDSPDPSRITVDLLAAWRYFNEALIDPHGGPPAGLIFTRPKWFVRHVCFRSVDRTMASNNVFDVRAVE